VVSKLVSTWAFLPLHQCRECVARKGVRKGVCLGCFRHVSWLDVSGLCWRQHYTSGLPAPSCGMNRTCGSARVCAVSLVVARACAVWWHACVLPPWTRACLVSPLAQHACCLPGLVLVSCHPLPIHKDAGDRKLLSHTYVSSTCPAALHAAPHCTHSCAHGHSCAHAHTAGRVHTHTGTRTTDDEEAEIQAPATSHVDGILDNQVEVLLLPFSVWVEASGLEARVLSKLSVECLAS
jgi:hypothetical protein